MSPALRALGLALVCAHLAAASAPCGVRRVVGPGRPEANAAETSAHRHGDGPHGAAHGGSGHAAHGGSGHAAHGAATSAAGPHGRGPSPDAVASLRAPCPCGCDRAPGRNVPGQRLDPGLLLAGPAIEGALVRFEPPEPAPAPPRVAPDTPEPVPILA
ncbi:MAG TPA: hypothetical protein VKB65_07535 [Myxococcota bacterium]|nr:hypothetical protein [Myxococcota bacterium]